jgi:hypothetical protein
MNRQLGVRTLVLPAFVAAASTPALHAMLATHN